MSGTYERMNYITSFGFSIRWRKQFLAKLGRNTEKLNVIDLLSGQGENWQLLKKNFPNAAFTAVDFSEQMVLRSVEKGNRVFDGKLELLCEDLLAGTLPSGHFDIVSCAYGLKTFDRDQLKSLASEVNRILKKGGKFSFVEVSKPENKVLRLLYGFYLSKVIPLLGRLMLGDPHDYRMLWIYTSKFEKSTLACGIFEEQGLKVRYERYFFGCASGFSGKKTE